MSILVGWGKFRETGSILTVFSGVPCDLEGWNDGLSHFVESLHPDPVGGVCGRVVHLVFSDRGIRNGHLGTLAICPVRRVGEDVAEFWAILRELAHRLKWIEHEKLKTHFI